MESGIWDHMDLAGIILTAVFGILFPALCLGAWRLSVRTRESEVKLSDLDKDVNALASEVHLLAPLVGDFQRLDERCLTRCSTDAEFRKRNDDAHERIENEMTRNRDERIAQIDQLKADLIREFHKSNGHSK